MTDYEKFAQYWEQAVNGLAYRLSQEKSPVLTRNKVQAIWKEELLEKRFFSKGVKHGASVFLEELKAERPKVAELVIHRLNTSELLIGTDGKFVAGNAVLAAAGLTTACVDKLNALARFSSLAVGGTCTVNVVKETANGTKSVLQQALEEKTAEHLLAYKALLEAAE